MEKDREDWIPSRPDLQERRSGHLEPLFLEPTNELRLHPILVSDVEATRIGHPLQVSVHRATERDARDDRLNRRFGIPIICSRGEIIELISSPGESDSTRESGGARHTYPSIGRIDRPIRVAVAGERFGQNPITSEKKNATLWHSRVKTSLDHDVIWNIACLPNATQQSSSREISPLFSV